MSTTWRTVRVFISSTFRDMREERDVLIKHVFPQLRKLCDERGVTFTDVDLRWGVTDEQKAEGRVLPICLAEITKCRPYYIGMLGERYGWVPDEIPQELIEQEPWLAKHREHSVTELETLHGVLNNPAMANRACFYFRDPAYLDTLPPEQRDEYREGPTPEEIEKYGRETAVQRAATRARKLQGLKEQIRDSGLALRENYPDPKTLCEWVLRDLSTAISQDFPEVKHSPLDREAADHDAFARSRARVYIRREDSFRRLDEHARGSGEPLVILGESGVGKSALVANWAIEYSDAHPDDLVLIHFVGSSPYSADWAAMLRRIMGEFKRRFGIEHDIPDKPDEARTAFANWLHMAAAKGRTVLILDGLNHLEDRDGAPDLVWLPPVIPDKVRLILSTLPGRPLDDLTRRGWPTLVVKPLEPPERMKVLWRSLRQYRKKLNKSRRRRIVAAAQTANPLYLRALLEELRVFGAHEQLDARIGHYLQAQTIPALYVRILERYEEDYESERPGLVRDAMSLIWAARRGLSEAELLDLLGSNGQRLPRVFFTPLHLAAESSLVSRSGLLGFGHNYLREAVQRRYLPTGAARSTAHGWLADYFAGQALFLPADQLGGGSSVNVRKVDEEPWQLLQGGALDRLAQTLEDCPFAGAVFALNEDDLLRYWARLEEAKRSRVGDAFRAVIDRPEAAREHLAWISHLLEVTGDKNNLLRVLQARERLARSEGDERCLLDCLDALAVMLYWESPWPDPAHVVSPEELNAQGPMRLLKEHERLAERLGDKVGLQRGLGTQAQLLIWCQQYWLALDLLKRQQALCEESRDLRGLARCFGNIAYVQNLLFQEDEALQSLKHADGWCREAADLLLRVQLLDNRGMVLKDLHRPYEALAAWQEGARIATDLGFKTMLRLLLGKLDKTYSYLGAYEAAMSLLQTEERLCREMGDKVELARCTARRKQLGGGVTRRPLRTPPSFEAPPRRDDPARRDGIVAVLRTIADDQAHFFPAAIVVADVLSHVGFFVLADTLTDPARSVELAATPRKAFKARWDRSCAVLAPLGDALYHNACFRELAAADSSFRDLLQFVGSSLLHQVFPGLGYSATEAHSAIRPILRCSLLLIGVSPSAL